MCARELIYFFRIEDIYMLASLRTIDDRQNLNQIAHIKGKKFTKREIDVIACLVCGRAASIPSFLSISSRTVETHVHNIMLKIECNSREGIIDFIEHSDTLPCIRAHYQSLVSDVLFEKSLKAIAVHVKAEKVACTLWYEPNDPMNHMDVIHKLIKHLKLLGIDTTLKSKKGLSSLHVAASADKAFSNIFSLSILSEEEYASHCALASSAANENETNIIKDQIFIRLDRMHNNGSEEIESDFFASSAYYSSVFETLKRLYTKYDLMPFMVDFNARSLSIGHENMSARDTAVYSQSEMVALTKSAQRIKTWQDSAARLLNYRSTYAFLFALIIAIALLFAERTGDHADATSFQKQGKQSIRSDLRVPVDSAFLVRTELVTKINEHFSARSSVKKNTVVGLVGLVGIGGAGKTTLARAYAKTQTNAIVWEINAETRVSLIDSFMNLAYALSKPKEHKEELAFIKEIPNTEEKEKQLVSFVKGRLKQHPNWLLIYDNAESFEAIKYFFPHDTNVWGEGNVIITTRDSNILNSSHVGEANAIHVDQLSHDEALMLFCKILFQKEPKELSADETERVCEFLTKIPPFPLDVSVAAYYIKNASLTLDQYIERLTQNSQTFDKGQRAFLKENSDYTETRYHLITLSATKLMETNPEYKDLLFLMCLLDSQNIPLNLLSFYKDPVLVDQFIHDLKRYSLITCQSDFENANCDGFFSVHRSTQQLLQFFLLNLLDKDNKKVLFEEYIKTIINFCEKNNKNSYVIFLNMIPHLYSLLKNIDSISVDEAEKNKYKQDIMYLIGELHIEFTRNLVDSKKYLEQAYQLQELTNHLSNQRMAVLLKNLAEINVNLYNNDEGIVCAEKSIEFCSNISQSDILVASNLIEIAVAYTYKNDFKKASQALQKALHKVSHLDAESKKEIESRIYDAMGKLYSSVYINTSGANDGIRYLKKALEIVDGSQTYYNNKQKPKKKICCNILWYKRDLGKAYCRLGDYKEAAHYIKDAQFIIDQSLDNCSHNLSKVNIATDMGEINLRSGQLEAAKSKFIEAMHTAKKLIGENPRYIIMPRIFCIEAQIRLGELKEAYEDCLLIFKTEDRACTNYLDLMVITGQYHAAVIKQKQGDLKKSYEHFRNFFEKIKPICKVILSDSKYRSLEEKKAFDITAYHDATAVDVSKQCLQQSMLIFSVIYGEEHPFVNDYVRVNCAG